MRAKVMMCLALCLVVLASCSLGLSSISRNDVTPIATTTYQAQPRVTAQYCTDDTGDYPRPDFMAANVLVAHHLVEAIVPNWGGAVLYVTLIASNTADPFNSMTPFFVDPIPAYPPVPTPLPVPTATNPLTQTSVTQDIHNQDDKNVQQYNAEVTSINNMVLQSKKTTLAHLQPLIKLNPQLDDRATDIWGCLQVARARFQGQAGTKLLVIASGMQNTTDVNYTANFVSSHALKGVIVKVIFFYTSGSTQYEQIRKSMDADIRRCGCRIS